MVISPVQQNELVDIGAAQTPLRLAINTAQYGRTFQDRSHVFKLRKRPDSIKDDTIYNLNVRGKRGNIVQTYPAVEYDFIPNKLTLTEDDLVHIQWTGIMRCFSNSNYGFAPPQCLDGDCVTRAQSPGNDCAQLCILKFLYRLQVSVQILNSSRFKHAQQRKPSWGWTSW